MSAPRHVHAGAGPGPASSRGCARAARRARPRSCSSELHRDARPDAAGAGAAGYITKRSDVDELCARSRPSMAGGRRGLPGPDGTPAAGVLDRRDASDPRAGAARPAASSRSWAGRRRFSPTTRSAAALHLGADGQAHSPRARQDRRPPAPQLRPAGPSRPFYRPPGRRKTRPETPPLLARLRRPRVERPSTVQEMVIYGVSFDTGRQAADRPAQGR